MKYRVGAAALALAVGFAPAAFAGDGDVDVSGSLTAWVASTDNALLSPTNEQDDTIWGLKGNFEAGSKSDSGSFSFHGAAATTRFADFDDESTFDWDLGLDASLALGEGTLTFGGDYADGSEDRHAVTARRDTRHPTEVATTTLYAGLSGDMGEVELAAKVNYVTADYSDDRHRIFLFNIDQDHRDRGTWSESLRATFSPDAEVSWFGEISATQVDYDRKPPFTLHNRDSDGWAAVIGVNVKMTDQVSGMASIGWGGRSFSEPGFKDVDDVVINVALDWTAGPDTDFSIKAARDFQETNQAFSPVYVSTSVRLDLSHDFNEQWGAGVYLSQEWAEHEQVDRDDEVTGYGVNVTFHVSETVGITASWDHFQLDSDGIFATSEYDENRFGAAISWRF